MLVNTSQLANTRVTTSVKLSHTTAFNQLLLALVQQECIQARLGWYRRSLVPSLAGGVVSRICP